MEILSMDGHGIYVWTAYVLTFCIVVGLAVIPLLKLRKFKQQSERDKDSK